MNEREVIANLADRERSSWEPRLSARAIKTDRYGWFVQWSDGAWSFEASEADARTCERFPNLTHPGVERRVA